MRCSWPSLNMTGGMSNLNHEPFKLSFLTMHQFGGIYTLDEYSQRCIHDLLSFVGGSRMVANPGILLHYQYQIAWPMCPRTLNSTTTTSIRLLEESVPGHG